MKEKHIQHLYHRAGFGIDIETLENCKQKSKKEIISNIFQSSEKNTPLNIDLSDFEILKQQPYKVLKKN